jgi:hypothetical protein
MPPPLPQKKKWILVDTVLVRTSSPPHLNDCIFTILGQNIQIEKPSDLVELHCITHPALGTQ